jgi:hypothetical protein
MCTFVLTQGHYSVRQVTASQFDYRIRFVSVRGPSTFGVTADKDSSCLYLNLPKFNRLTPKFQGRSHSCAVTVL